jgi:predicted metal-dependent hydrolase
MNSLSSAYPKEVSSKQTFQYGNKTIEYILIQSKRRKTIEVIVDKDQITIRSPFDKPIKEIQQMLNDKIKWISQKQKEIQIEKPEIIKPIFEEHSTLPYLGINYVLKIIYTEKSKEKVEFDNDLFTIYLTKEECDSNEKIRSLYNNWLVHQANQIFKEKVNKYSKVVDVEPKKIIIKNLKNRWGSITRNKTINLNVNLLKAPEDIIDYIIIHELCHLKIKGHSYHFWDYLRKFSPDYKKKIDWLKRNTYNIISN